VPVSSDLLSSRLNTDRTRPNVNASSSSSALPSPPQPPLPPRHQITRRTSSSSARSLRRTTLQLMSCPLPVARRRGAKEAWPSTEARVRRRAGWKVRSSDSLRALGVETTRESGLSFHPCLARRSYSALPVSPFLSSAPSLSLLADGHPLPHSFIFSTLLTSPLSHFLSVSPGLRLLSDMIVSSPILAGEDAYGGQGGAFESGPGEGGSGGGGGSNFEFGVDPDMDPELAMVRRSPPAPFLPTTSLLGPNSNVVLA
jgi:hypothetical protein